jgi:hypothetical protein
MRKTHKICYQKVVVVFWQNEDEEGVKNGHSFNSQNPRGSMCTSCFNIQKLRILPTGRIYVFPMVITLNGDYLPKQINRLAFVTEM